ncbi:hypothetical protein JA9_000646 [Meyerozyma sp. JA9]|nr:hypothetical protein JA9_000646 [Meyerozyma sp. JA9]
MSAIDPSIYPSSYPEAPKLVPVFEFTVKSSEAQSVLKQQSLEKNSVVLPLVNGTIRPIDNAFGLKFEAKNIIGHDYITFDKSVGAGKLDCRLYGETSEGTGFTLRYDGIMKLSEKIVAVLETQTREHAPFEDVFIGASFIIELSEGAKPDEKWVTAETLVGKGRLVVGKDDGATYAQYIAHVIR